MHFFLQILMLVTTCTIVGVMDFETWMNDLTGGATRRAIATKIGYAQSTITRQLDRGSLRPEMVIALCRAYGRLPAQGLIETGYLRPWEVEGAGIPHALDKATNQQLLDAILRRSDPEATYLFGMGDEQINPDADVLDLPRRTDATPAIRAVSDDDLPYVADSSPDHPEEDIEFDD
ncbi:HTH DNA binding protein [Corynebacterium phage Dina]|uniref:Immunity repressor n=1 Tax=Corynebacterium phage Dina TaxID=2588501 RepID=A0A4Y6ENP0_9CAUD|nr:HTH DNA binding protein [Corynebacterium phage Dina]QDF19675.1 immunity repressor [Corynebacterium phage Dina]